MNERELFLSALEIGDPAARRAHLESACADDVALLARVEALLASHESQSRFLNTPVVEQIRNDSAGRTDTTILLGNGSTHDEEPDGATPGSNGPQPMPENRGDLSDEVPLKYVQPTSKTDSIGRLAHYEVLEVVGRGAFGTVLRAFDEKLRRVVAIKVLSPEMAATSPARKRFIREARSSAAVRHKNVVSIYAVEDDPTPYLVMDYIPGQTLQQRLDEHGPLDLPDVLRLGKQIADGLAAAHAEGLIHRDIKPGNILLETGLVDHVRITDFGLARTADDASMTRSGVIAGTPMYMAPEQALGRKLDQRADLFSFGSVLYQMLCGHPPFRAPTTMAVLKRVARDTPRPIQEIIPEVPDWMCQLVGHLLAKNPDHRYGTAKEVSDLLAQCLADVQVGRKPRIPAPSLPGDDPARKQIEKVRPRSLRRTSRRPLAAAAAVALLLLVGLGITEATGVTNLTSTVARLTTGSEPGSDAEQNGIRARLPELEPELAKRTSGAVSGDLPESGAAVPPRAELEREMLRRAQAITVFRSEPDGEAPVEPVAGRLHSYDNPARKLTAATVWAWGSSGRPVTLLAEEVYDRGEAGMLWGYEVVALSAESLVVESEDGPWQSPPLSAALDFRPFPEAPATADSASGRLTQMRALLKRLKGVESFGRRIELLPLPDPLHRYTAPQDGIVDGGLFALAEGANPEVVVLIELQGSSLDDGQWRYALSRLGGVRMSVSLDGTEVWAAGEAEESKTGSYWVYTEATASSGVTKPPPTQPIHWPTDAPPPAIAPFDAEQAREHQEQWAAYLKIPAEYTNSIGMKFVLIPPGEFLMGSTPEEIEAALAAAGNDELWKVHIRSEAPQHKVVLTQPIYMGMHEVTQAQYQQVMGTNPSHFAAIGAGKDAVASLDTRNHPVEMVSWNDAAEFCAKLSEQEGLKPFYRRSGRMMFILEGTGYRLPTEAEWEFACRGGTTTRFWCGDRDEDLVQAGWFGSKAGGRTHPVGELKANPFGLFDIHCNVWEWVQDGWEPNYGRFANRPAVDPKGSPSARSPRVIRGGGWDHHLASSSRATDRRSAVPRYRNYHIGFRVAMAVP